MKITFDWKGAFHVGAFERCQIYFIALFVGLILLHMLAKVL